MFNLRDHVTRKKIEYKLQSKTSYATGSCWIWMGARKIDYDGSTGGYGLIFHLNKAHKVHRLSAALYLNYDLDSDLQINHKNECTSRACWNPDHLYIGTKRDNILDYGKTITHCPKGHLYTKENSLLRRGTRECRDCRRQQSTINNARIRELRELEKRRRILNELD